jgi:hypothetical protein
MTHVDGTVEADACASKVACGLNSTQEAEPHKRLTGLLQNTADDAQAHVPPLACFVHQRGKL